MDVFCSWSPAFVADAESAGHQRPVFIGHENIPAASTATDSRTAGTCASTPPVRLVASRWGITSAERRRFLLPTTSRRTDTTATSLDLHAGDHEVRLFHGRARPTTTPGPGCPTHGRAPATSSSGSFPNAGNPQKVQRYPREWARALRAMAATSPSCCCRPTACRSPARERDRHGARRHRRPRSRACRRAFGDDERRRHAWTTIVHEVRVPDDLLAKPCLRPIYDEPEFVVRNIWRLYGGWWDGNPAPKPAPDAALAAEWRRSPAAPTVSPGASWRTRATSAWPATSSSRRPPRPRPRRPRHPRRDLRAAPQGRDVADDEGHLRLCRPREPRGRRSRTAVTAVSDPIFAQHLVGVLADSAARLSRRSTVVRGSRPAWRSSGSCRTRRGRRRCPRRRAASDR